MKRNHVLLLVAVVCLVAAALLMYRNAPRTPVVEASVPTDLVLRCAKCGTEVVVSYDDPNAAMQFESTLRGDQLLFKCKECSTFTLRIVQAGGP